MVDKIKENLDLLEKVNTLEKTVKKFDDRVRYLEGISTAEYMDKKLDEIANYVTDMQGKLQEQINIWEAFRRTFQISTIGLQEVQHWVKVSGCIQQELCDILHCDVTTVSKLLNGVKVRENHNDYALIKAYCLEKMAKNMVVKK